MGKTLLECVNLKKHFDNPAGVLTAVDGISFKLEEGKTLGILGFIGYERILWGQMAAATIICVIPELLLAFIVQKYIIRGLTFGAVKG